MSGSIQQVTRWVGFDTETTGLNSWTGARPWSLAIIDGFDGEEPDENCQIRYYEWTVDPHDRSVKVPEKDRVEIQKILGDPKIAKVGHNVQFDLFQLESLGFTFRGEVHDTMFAAKVYNTAEYVGYGLKLLAQKYAGIPSDDQKKLQKDVAKLRRYAKKLNWNLASKVEPDYWLVTYARELLAGKVSLEEIEEIEKANQEYNVGDVVRTIMLWKHYRPLIEADPDLTATYLKEIELLPVVRKMIRRGVAIYLDELGEQITSAETRIAQCLEELQNEAAKKGFLDFNPRSNAQLGAYLFSPKGLNLEVDETTASGEPSTSWDALRQYTHIPFVSTLLQYRAYLKADSTFYQKYKALAVPDPLVEGGYAIHANFKQLGASTGRYSCDEPNLQNSANASGNVRGESTQARTCFGPRPGYFWYHWDFSQMEVRVFASEAQIPAMLDALTNGRDLNNEIANRVWGGKNNPAALEACSQALDFGKREPSNDLVKAAWEKLDWNPEKSRKGSYSEIALTAAEKWMKEHDYDIVVSEKAVGKNNSRNRGKMVNFSKLYGGGPEAIMGLIYADYDEAKKVMAQFDRAFPEINQYIQWLSGKAKRDGFIRNLWGRKIRVDRDAPYKSVNYFIQGSCADFLKDRQLAFEKFKRDIGFDIHQVMAIHDELVIEWRADQNYLWALRAVSRLMEDHGGRIKIAMPTECKRAVRWDKKVKVDMKWEEEKVRYEFRP